ncbi:MAG TPA: dihydrolipoamide acetyltransferase family protein [Vicinamibacterales bacterium]|nr:dihydrolipoamide acetyltransferase family protein [Vicinamibacterales bacterium]
MATPVVMPQMGESIAEGTIVRWIKKVGDTVDRDEPLFEISTDKVDAEIPSPAAGVLTAISVKEGETVPVNSVVATIGAAGEAAQPDAPSGAGSRAQSAQADGTPGATVASPAPPSTTHPGAPRAVEAPPASQAPVSRDTAPDRAPQPAGARDGADGERHKSSPLVRRIAKEHNVDISRVPGSGIGGRVTKHDILGFIEGGGASAEARSGRASNESLPQGAALHVRPAAGDQIVPMSVMRRKIAEHMVLSKRTSAHVYSVFEVNYSRVDQIRKARKDEYERAGVKLTFTSFIAKVAVDCLRRHQTINASIDGDNVIYRGEINLGIAVALENGLIVPVVKAANEKNTLGLSRAIQDIADRARAKKLNPEEVQNGTFTITNPGNFGAQFGLPIINQPQVAILGVGTIEKRPVVVDDAIGIRLMGYLTLGYDHRLVDGAVADQFMADVKKGIENFDPSQV